MKHGIFVKKHTSSAVIGVKQLCSLWQETQQSWPIWDLPVQDLFILTLGGGGDLSSIYKQPLIIGYMSIYDNMSIDVFQYLIFKNQSD